MKLSKLFLMGGALAAFGGLLSAPAHAQSGTQFIGQISAFGGSYCPREWADASGGLLPISQNSALFAIIGTQFGGDGRTTMGLPDLRGRRPIGAGNGPGIGNFVMGQRGGSFQFNLLATQLPSHTHTGSIAASPNAGDTNQPVRNSFAQSPAGTNNFVSGDPAVSNMHGSIIRVGSTGNDQTIQKQSPFQAVRWCIALTGIFPSRS